MDFLFETYLSFRLGSMSSLSSAIFLISQLRCSGRCIECCFAGDWQANLNFASQISLRVGTSENDKCSEKVLDVGVQP